MYKSIIFDFFDVIRTDAYKTWLNKHGFPLAGEFLRAVQLMDRGDIESDAFLEILREITGQPVGVILREMETGAKIDYAVLAIIEKLRERYSIGLLSNASSSFLRGLLKDHDLEKYFDEIVISSEVGLIKPSPEAFHHILSKLRVEPDEALFIDDNIHNVQGAQQVGIAAIHFTRADILERELIGLGVL